MTKNTINPTGFPKMPVRSSPLRSCPASMAATMAFRAKPAWRCRLQAHPRRRRLTVDEYVAGVLAGDRNVLGQTITLVESNSQAHFDMGQEVLRQLIPHTGNSIRIGITGVPGAGKSTFIEALGLHLCEQGHKVAVLAVDPNSTVTRGSILGDKTRMELLSRDLRAFIRPPRPAARWAA